MTSTCAGCARGDAAATLGDDPLAEGADLVELRPQRSGRQIGVAGRIDETDRRHVDAAGDTAGPAVGVAAAAGVLRRLQRVDRAAGSVADRRQYLVLVDHQWLG